MRKLLQLRRRLVTISLQNSNYSCSQYRNIVNYDKYYIPATSLQHHNTVCNQLRRQFSTTCTLSRVKTGKTTNKSQVHIDFREISQAVDAEKLVAHFDKALEVFKEQLIKYVSLRSTIGAIEQVPIKFEGDEYTLQDLVQISRKPKLLVLNASAFPQTIPDILKALSSTQMRLNPQQEGTTIYVQTPKVTKEHRENLAKHAKSLFNNCNDKLRDVRNEHIKKVKKEKDNGMELNLAHRIENSIDALFRQYVDKAKELLDAKQKELLRVLE
ncbi:hypothetical protein KM043_013526 [Ampulex compressa]|nr:hypothetical protein KM043_013526 [Ampulex compressa]